MSTRTEFVTLNVRTRIPKAAKTPKQWLISRLQA